RGEGGQNLLDSYHTERHPLGKSVIGFTGVLTKVGTLQGGAQRPRNAVIRVVSGIRPATGTIASNVQGTSRAKGVQSYWPPSPDMPRSLRVNIFRTSLTLLEGSPSVAAIRAKTMSPLSLKNPVLSRKRAFPDD